MNIMEKYNLEISQLEPAGSDPRYLDEFEAIRIELEKLSGCDFEFIENSSKYLLNEKSKDLRVAAYLILALTFNKSVKGLIEGLVIYNGLLKTFGTQLHPTRPAARTSAIKWLNQARLEAFLSQVSISEEQILIKLKSEIDNLNQLIKKIFPELNAQFIVLNSWLSSQKITLIKKDNPVSKVINLLKSNKVEPEISQSKSAVIDNEKDYIEAVKELVNYCKNNNLSYQKLILTRLMRWHGLEVPVANSNKILLELRKEAIRELDGLANIDCAQKQLDSSEALFMETGGQFCLDLQYYTCDALAKLGETDPKEQLELMVSQLIKKHPKLIDLQYKDLRPFANSKTKQWLQALGKTKQQDVVVSQSSGEFKNHQEFLEQAVLQARDKTLASQLSQLRSIAVNCPREEIEKDFAIAKLLSKKQSELACYQYQSLLTRVQEQNLELWLPELASQILSSYLQLLKMSRASDEELSLITKWLCRLDPLACF